MSDIEFIEPVAAPDLSGFDADALHSAPVEVAPDNSATPKAAPKKRKPRVSRKPAPVSAPPTSYEEDFGADDEAIPAPPPDDDPKQRRILLADLARGKDLFPDIYKLVVRKKPEALALADLKLLKEELDMAINTRTSRGAFKYVLNAGLYAAETKLGPAIGQNWNGLTHVFNENPAYKDILKELEYKYGASRYVAPELKLLIAVAGVGNTLNQQNKLAAISRATASRNDIVQDNLAQDL